MHSFVSDGSEILAGNADSAEKFIINESEYNPKSSTASYFNELSNLQSSQQFNDIINRFNKYFAGPLKTYNDFNGLTNDEKITYLKSNINFLNLIIPLQIFSNGGIFGGNFIYNFVYKISKDTKYVISFIEFKNNKKNNKNKKKKTTIEFDTKYEIQSLTTLTDTIDFFALPFVIPKKKKTDFNYNYNPSNNFSIYKCNGVVKGIYGAI